MIAPEPERDIAAQIAAVANPASAKHAAFMAAGTPVGAVPKGMWCVQRKEGTLITDSPSHAAAFRWSRRLTDGLMARLLGYPETKAEALQGARPVVVQAMEGSAVAYECVTSPGGLTAAMRAARAAVPGARIRITTPEEALARRRFLT